MPRRSRKSIFPRSSAERQEIREQRIAKHLKEVRTILVYSRNLMKMGTNRLSAESIHHMDESSRLIEEIRGIHRRNTPQD